MKRNILILTFLSILASSVAQQVPRFSDSSTHIFAIRSTDTLRLDLYHPLTPRADRATVVYVHGGAFLAGIRNSASTRGDFACYLEEGFSVAAIDYRKYLRTVGAQKMSKRQMIVNLDSAVAEATADLAAAIGYLVNNADKLNIDATKLILTGVSAGGMTVLGLDHARVNGYARAKELPKDFKPAAIVSYAGALFSLHGDIEYNSAPAPTAFLYGNSDKVVPYSCLSLFNIHFNGSECLIPIFEDNNYIYWSFCYQKHGHEVCAYTPYTLPEFNAFIDAVFAGRKPHFQTSCRDDRFKLTDFAKITLPKLVSTEGAWDKLLEDGLLND